MSESFNSVANETAVTAATVRPGHGYPADRLETSPEPTGWQGSGADSALNQGDKLPGSFASAGADATVVATGKSTPTNGSGQA